eukprot:TRINITY_DN569_c1_g1_i2.p1 TRINITY_DN569_c1_g1~~TRINITY_DN569_c1_g1_i2.p1  ORF type:complete len:817 (+),score=174.68 TRINITY_DN569_c1_g1_i2:1517-3967(+)
MPLAMFFSKDAFLSPLVSGIVVRWLPSSCGCSRRQQQLQHLQHHQRRQQLRQQHLQQQQLQQQRLAAAPSLRAALRSLGAAEPASRRVRGCGALLALLDAAVASGGAGSTFEVPAAALSLQGSEEVLALAGAQRCAGANPSAVYVAFPRQAYCHVCYVRDELRAYAASDAPSSSAPSQPTPARALATAAAPPVAPGIPQATKAHGAAAAATAEDELAWAIHDSLRLAEERLQAEPQPGRPATSTELRAAGFYFEAQPQGHATCGVCALNNLTQRRLYSVEDLQRAEVQLAQRERGRQLGEVPREPSAGEAASAPREFFDVEALKGAASRHDYEIVELEPANTFDGSIFKEFVDAYHTDPAGASWFLGFLVYDGRPEIAMHYYVLCQAGRQSQLSFSWLKLDSLQRADDGGTADYCRNRFLSADDLRLFYEENAPNFAKWQVRWYPVVHRPSAVQALQAFLVSHGVQSPTESRARRVLQRARWLLPRAYKHLLDTLPDHLERELMVLRLSVSEVDARQALSDCDGQASAAAQQLGEMLQRRASGGLSMDTIERRYFLGLCDWDIEETTKLVALKDRLSGSALSKEIPLLLHALKLSSGNLLQAEAIASLARSTGSPEASKQLLEQLGRNGSVKTAEKILVIRKSFPTVQTAIAMEALRRGDDDARAAGELLASLRQRAEETVREANKHGTLTADESARTAQFSLDSAGWEPSRSLHLAGRLPAAIAEVRQLLASKLGALPSSITLDAIHVALSAYELEPRAAAGCLLQGGQLPPPRLLHASSAASSAKAAEASAMHSAHIASAEAQSADEDANCFGM